MPSSADTRPRRIYLDAAGSAPVLTEVQAALASVPWANPSSLHSEARDARAALDSSRDSVAASLRVASSAVTFCSSGTEAVNLAVKGAARRLGRSRRTVTWAAEHQAVLSAVRELELEGFPVAVLPADEAGTAQLDEFPDDAGVVTIGLANNEVGTVQPVEDVSRLCRRGGAWLHIDACQGPAWLDLDPSLYSLASLSGHKIGAGRGGVLVLQGEARVEPLLRGGPQEWGRRAGREDVAAAVAVAAALAMCTECREGESLRVRPLAARLRAVLVEVGGSASGSEQRLPNFASATFSSRRGEDMLMQLDLAGIAASSGSACASGSLDPSHVLLAMGRSLEEALGSLRLTLSYATSEAEIDSAVELLREVLG